jgi:hypothetical protein
MCGYKRLYIRYYSQKTNHLNVICRRAFIEHASKAATMITEICMLYMHQFTGYICGSPTQFHMLSPAGNERTHLRHKLTNLTIKLERAYKLKCHTNPWTKHTKINQTRSCYSYRHVVASYTHERNDPQLRGAVLHRCTTSGSWTIYTRTKVR